MKKPLITSIGYALMFLIVQAVAQTIVLGVSYLATGELVEQPSGAWLIATMALFSVGAAALFASLRWAPVSFAYLRSRPWGVLAWSVVAAVGAIVPSMALQELLPEWPGALGDLARQSETLFQDIVSTRGGYLVLALLAPIAEELVFRGAILRTLLEWKPQRRWAMIALSAFLFALCHLNPAQLPHAFAIGLLLGWLYCRTRSVLPGIIYHWVNNSVAYFLMVLYPNPDITLGDILGQRVLLAVLFSLLIFIPAVYQLNLRMKPADRN